MSTTETLQNLKLHKMSNETYNAKVGDRSIDNTALYLTPAPALEGNNISITEDTTNNKIIFSVNDGTTSQKGIVQLSSTTGSAENVAATPKGVQDAINALDVNEPTASGTSTTFIATAKQENGKIVVTKANLPEYLDTNVKLSEDVWTDKTIGCIDATAIYPKKVASKNDSLRTMFTNIFGTVTEDTSNLVTNPYFSSVSIGSSSYEYGTKLNSVSVTVSPVSGSYKYGPTVSGAGWNGNYTLSGTGFTTKKDSPNDTQTVKLSSTFTVGTSSALTLTVSRAYNAATNTANSKMGAATTQKIAAGTATKSGTLNPTAVKYVYWATSSNTTTPTSWTLLGTGTTSVNDMPLSCAANEYIWVATTTSATSFYAWNDASGKYNTDKLPTTSTGTTSITNSQSATASGYYIYRTKNKMLQAVDTKFKLV